MNKDKLKKCVGYRVLLEPVALRSGEPHNDVWTIEEVLDKKGVRIKNSATDHNKLLGFDSVHHYRSDPSQDYDGHTHGVLVLNVQIELRNREVIIKERPRE
ncbi:MAG: hypothetical protein NPIRA03_40200 [Nitrospirales bacterium]|nr:MAG: hypothetical protein NPIRA03_40200 [Nitrospirales bacterium]